MTINEATGVILWLDPVASPFLYTIGVHASNEAGTTTETMFLGVEPSPPQIVALPDQTVSCIGPWAGRTPQLVEPACMDPILNWSLDVAPVGMTVDHGSGVVSWLEAIPAEAQHFITLRATNPVGNGTVTWRLSVTAGDLTGDGDVNLDDHKLFVNCLDGPRGTNRPLCGCADADGDGDVDLHDAAAFRNRLRR